MKLINYNSKYEDEVKDLLVELQRYLVDIDDLNYQVLLKKYREEYFKYDLELVEKFNGKILLAKEENTFVGLIIGIIKKNDKIDKLTNRCEKLGSIIELVVKKDYRNKGIGNNLLKGMEKYFKIQECKSILIEVFGPNKKALDFYQSNDYLVREYILSKDISTNKDELLQKLQKFYIYSNKGFYIDEIVEKENYKLVSSNYIKDYDCNYIIDINEKVNFDDLIYETENEMKKIDAKPCYILTPLSKMYKEKEKFFTKEKFNLHSVELWQVFDNFKNLKNIDTKCTLDIKLQKTTDMNLLAQINSKAFNTGDNGDPYGKIDDGYFLAYQNYKGLYNDKYNRDFYVIKVENIIVGTVVTVYDDEIFGIYGLAILKEYRKKGIGKETLKKLLKICKRKEKKIAFLQTEEGYYPADFYKNFGFKDICKVYLYTLK